MHLPTPLTLVVAILAPLAVLAAPADDHHKGGPPSGLPSGISFPGGPYGTGVPPPPPSGGPSGSHRSHHGPKPTGTDFPHPPPSGGPSGSPRSHHGPKPTGTDSPPPPSGLPLSSS